METGNERRTRSEDYLESVVKTLTNYPRTPVKQFQVGGIMCLAWTRVSTDGIRSQVFTLGRVVEINGELRLRQELTPSELKAARRVLKKMRAWWKAEYRRAYPPWWRKLGKLLGIR